MEILYFFESIRNTFCDVFFSFITLFGEETMFLLLVMLLLWCVDKRAGYYLSVVGFVGIFLNQSLKMTFRVPRPWVLDPEFTIVESAREAATGYSFPSGHTQTSVGLFGGMARWNKNATLRTITIALCVLIPFSRLYLGVHTPADVGVSLVLAILLIFVGYPLFQKAEESPKVMYAILIGMTAFVVTFLCFVCFYPFPAEVYAADAVHNLQSAQKNAFTLTGCALGMLVVYTVDQKYLRFETDAVWWAQILKAAGGIAAVLLVKELLRDPLEALIPHALTARMIRYFFVVIMAGVVWPMTFRWFARLGNKS